MHKHMHKQVRCASRCDVTRQLLRDFERLHSAPLRREGCAWRIICMEFSSTLAHFNWTPLCDAGQVLIPNVIPRVRLLERRETRTDQAASGLTNRDIAYHTHTQATCMWLRWYDTRAVINMHARARRKLSILINTLIRAPSRRSVSSAKQTIDYAPRPHHCFRKLNFSGLCVAHRRGSKLLINSPYSSHCEPMMCSPVAPSRCVEKMHA